MSQLDEIISRLEGKSPDELAKLEQIARKAIGDRKFIPSPGPQTEAWYSEADVLLYGGEAGGGKSGLICGLALEQHRQSLLMRREGVDLEGGGGLIEELLKINGTRDGFSGKPPPTLRTNDERIITFGSARLIGDEQKYMGRARDFLGLDEATQFAEVQVRFLMGWVRTTYPGQRTRTVLATNPPISTTGDYIIGMFRPWLDITHDNPAKFGELRWYVTVRDGSKTVDLEVDGPQKRTINGETVIPHSRTFIPAKLSDNPFIQTEEYQKVLDALPEPYRSAVRDGNFMAVRQDAENQIIPAKWVQEAMDRWTSKPPDHAPMSCLALDVAQGGGDDGVIAKRYDAWFDELSVKPGADTPKPSDSAAWVIQERLNGCTIVVDLGGGYGGGVKERLEENGMEVTGFKGAKESVRRTKDKTLEFTNLRTEALWRLREALDPDQEGGSPVALPPDPELMSDLTTPTFEVTTRGIKAMPKEKVKEILGRSPGKGDAVMMCNLYGPTVVTHGNQWRKYNQEHGLGGNRTPSVVRNRMAARRKR